MTRPFPSNSSRKFVSVEIFLSFLPSCQPIKMYATPKTIEGRQHKKPFAAVFHSLCITKDAARKHPVISGARIIPMEDKRQQLILVRKRAVHEFFLFSPKNIEIQRYSR